MMNDDPKKQSRPRTLHTDEKCVPIKDFIKEDLRTKAQSKNQLCITSHPLLFKHVKWWDKYLNADRDNMEK
jgi:hypothetical protein